MNDVVNTVTAESATAGQRDFELTLGPLVEPGLRLAFAMLGDRSEAEDATQEALLRAWRRLPQLRDTARLRPWFLAIVTNQCRNVRRTRWFSTIRFRSVFQPPAVSAGRFERVDLERALNRLPMGDRQILFMRYYLDLPVEEIATAMGISTAAAKGRIYRACQRLRPDLLEEEF